MTGHTTAHARPPAPPRRRGRALLPHAAVLAGAAAGATLVAFVDPNEAGHYPSCPFLTLTGLYCPGCGMTRMAHALTHGDVGVAFGLNPLMFVLLPVFGYLYARWAVLSARGRPMRSALFRPVPVFAFLGVIVVYWILRNLPFAQALAP
ncbi:DUF2752 domain-containing protein [Actinomadura algeriensis]|uniref:DUF2752 domain-containing protein n=1 Tax=Actinomadura algeriensis TaxID=1679523 RepID=A0ABR9JXM9_9ACTN|nr:DUF2752 domain-containing protein [Actinomadura algeriensis]MBE1535337.1 hypothetical protein [Actinomadura algeriensis]